MMDWGIMAEIAVVVVMFIVLGGNG